jgi:hypothetical protein
VDAKIAEAKAKKRRLLGKEARDRRKLENRRDLNCGAVLYEADNNVEVLPRTTYGQAAANAIISKAFSRLYGLERRRSNCAMSAHSQPHF